MYYVYIMYELMLLLCRNVNALRLDCNFIAQSIRIAEYMIVYIKNECNIDENFQIYVNCTIVTTLSIYRGLQM